MAKVLIVYYSRTGNTAKMADVVAEGARGVRGAEVDVRPAAECSVENLLDADAVVMGSPVYYGTLAAELKQLIDESVSHHGQLAGKVGGAFASSGGIGGGNETTVLDILKCLLVHGMIIEGDPTGDHYGPIAVGEPDGRSRDECRKLGRKVAELAARLHGA